MSTRLLVVVLSFFVSPAICAATAYELAGLKEGASYYEMLGLDESEMRGLDESTRVKIVEAAYCKYISMWNPALFYNCSPEEQEEAKAVFTLVTYAHDQLIGRAEWRVPSGLLLTDRPHSEMGSSASSTSRVTTNQPKDVQFPHGKCRYRKSRL